MELLQPYNLVFVLPFFFGLIYLFLMVSGMVSAEHEVEVEGDFDHHFDLGHHDIHHDVGHDHDHSHDGHDHDTPHHDSAAIKALGFLGFGKIPLALLLMSMCFVWGFLGWASNLMLKPILVYPAVYIGPSLVIALVGTLIFAHYLAHWVSKLMPNTETFATKARDLVGRTGKVRFTLTETSGTVMVHDKFNNLQQISCRVSEGSEALPVNTPVLIIDYVAAQDTYVARKNDLSEAAN